MSEYGFGPYGSGPFGGAEVLDAGRIEWNRPEDRIFESGLDRGVLYPKNASAVAWNGLTAVDEDGGEGSATYYMDGRPFLHLPKPKEFSANLKAYTYPDEFAVMMGLIEATDGLYLDSQMGDSFDLSYRSKVGNAIEGSDFGYKIHLVYNATVDPTQVSYSTHSNSVNPLEFSWSIKAVPSPVVGYRPTAHIIIDTRDIDPGKLSDLEDLIYGTASTAAELPPPQVIFDILKFGDTIIITDLGDGTWTAEGSSEHITMLTDDVFEISEVTAVDNGDETYDISTTL